MKHPRSFLLMPILILYATLGFSNPVLSADLIVQGSDNIVIDSTTYIQTGNIYIKDSGKLTINNSKLILNLSYHEQYEIYVSGNGTLSITNSTVTTSMPNENVVIVFQDNTSFTFQNSNLNEGYVYIIFGSEGGYGATFNGNANIDNSKIGNISLMMLPTGSGVISVNNSSCNVITYRFSGGYSGTFSDLKPGDTSWNYNQNGYNINFSNVNINNINAGCDGPANLTINNCEIFQFFAVQPLASITMTAINSKIYQVPLHGLSNITVSLSGLKTGLLDGWRLSQHYTGGPLPEIIFQNSQISNSWLVSGFSSSNITIDDSIIELRSYGNTDFSVTNSTITSLMLYNASSSAFSFNNAIILNSLNAYVPPNTAKITGNLTFGQNCIIQNWLSPTTITRNFPFIFTDIKGTGIPSATFAVYSPDGVMILNGQTDQNGNANFDINFDDTNYLKTFKLIILNKIEKEINLLISTPIIIRRNSSVPDFNGDGKTDILWRHEDAGIVSIWLMDGLNIVGQGSPGTVPDPKWKIQK